MSIQKSETFQHRKLFDAEPIISDYHMVTDGLDSIRLDELHGATLFAIMRNRSMFNADESALFYVYRVLQRWETTSGNVKQQYLRKQLRKEYGIPFENVMNALDSGIHPAPPTVATEELDAMITFFKKTGRFSEELRDYVPGAKGKKTVPRGIQVPTIHFFSRQGQAYRMA